MPTSPFSLRDTERLSGVHPELQRRLAVVFSSMAALGHRMFIVAGIRTSAQQQALYAQGRTTPGKIVTMKNGTTNRSDHQPWSDGYGHAVDCAFVGADPFGEHAPQPWQEYGEQVEAQGLIWGGRWSHPHDSPHAELPALAVVQAA